MTDSVAWQCGSQTRHFVGIAVPIGKVRALIDELESNEITVASVAPATMLAAQASGVTDPRQSIWVSFVAADSVKADIRALTWLDHHRQVAAPRQPWEATKIGAGTPPIRVPEGWLIIHHGVTKGQAPPGGRVPVRYVAGAMVLDPEDVGRVLSRSLVPLLEPETKEESQGMVDNVVFPTAIDVRENSEADVFYGMADFRIGAARLRRKSSRR